MEEYLKYPSPAHEENWLYMDWIREIQLKEKSFNMSDFLIYSNV